MIIGSEAYVRSIDLTSLPPIVINSTPLPYVSEARNLGVFMQNNLSWRSHVLYVSQKAYATLHKLKFHKCSLSQQLRIKLITTLIFLHIDYCCLVYHDLTAELNFKLQRLVNCAIRFIFDLRKDVHMTPYRHQLKWLPVGNRRLYFLGIFTYRIRYLKVASYLSELFVVQDPDMRRSSRSTSSTYFSIPLHRTVAYRNSFRLSAIYFWYSLPLHITTASLASFKRLLFDYLLALEVN